MWMYLSFAGLLAVVVCIIRYVQLKQDGKSTKNILPWFVASLALMLLFMVLDPVRRLAALFTLVSFVTFLISAGLLIANQFRKRLSSKALIIIILVSALVFALSNLLLPA